MKSLGYGDKSGLKVVDNSIVLNGDNSSLEFLKSSDVYSARALNRPLLNIFEEQEETNKLITALLKTVYGNFIGIVPNIYEGFDFSRFQYKSFKNNLFIRIPTGLLFLRKKITDDRSYYIPGELYYKDEITKDLFKEDESLGVVIQPNIGLFERQLAFLINFDLNDQDNDIKVNCKFVDGIPQYSITITDNSGEVVEIPKNYKTITQDGEKIKAVRDITYRDNSIDLFEDFVEYFSDYITLSDNELYKLNCLDTIIPIDSSFESGIVHNLYYRITGKETVASSTTDLTQKFYISVGSGDSNSVKICSFRYNATHEVQYQEVKPNGDENPSLIGWYEKTGEFEYKRSTDEKVNPQKKYYTQYETTNPFLDITPFVDTLDQRTIATKRAELDTLLVRRRSEIIGDTYIHNEKGGINLTQENFNIFNGDTNISVGEEELKIEAKEIIQNAEKISNTAKKSTNFDSPNINYNNVEKVRYTEGEREKLSLNFNENSLAIKYKDANTLNISDKEIVTYKNFVPYVDNVLTLGSPQRRFLKIYGNISGNTTTASMVYNPQSIVITNMSLTETRIKGHDIGKKILSDNSIIYHFDTDYLNNHGEDELEIEGEYELTSGLISEDEEITETPVLPHDPYQTEGQYLAGEFEFSKSFETEGDFTVDFWYKYNFNAELFRIGGDNEFISVQNHAAEVDFYTDVIESDDENELIPCVNFYKPSEVYENYIKDGYIKDNYVNSDFGKMVSGVLEPIYFFEKDESNNSLIALHNTNEFNLTHEDGKPLSFAKNDWIHCCITYNTSDNKGHLFLNEYQFDFQTENFLKNFTIFIAGVGVDELFIDPTVHEDFEYFSFFNESGSRLNWGTLDFLDHNFVVDIKDITKLYTNMFETPAFIEAVENIVRNMDK